MAGKKGEDTKPEKGKVQATLEKMGEVTIEFFRKDIEQKYEVLIEDFVRRFPAVRAIYEQFGKENLIRLLTLLIGQFPDVKAKGLSGKVLLLLREFMNLGPRELGRVLSEGRDLRPGGASRGTVSSVGPGAEIFKFLSGTLSGELMKFAAFYERLSLEQKSVVDRYILTRPDDEVKRFLDMTLTEREAMVNLLTPPVGTTAPSRDYAADLRKAGEWVDRKTPKTQTALRGALEGFRRRHPR